MVTSKAQRVEFVRDELANTRREVKKYVRMSASCRDVFVLAAVISACGGGRASVQQLAAGDLAIVGATVVPMDRPGTLVDQVVVVRGDKIALVAPARSVDTARAKVIDAKGKWLVPGLADMHVHTHGEQDFGLYLLNGVTTVRDMFGSPQHLAWRAQLAAGTLDGPTLITAGPIVDGDPPTWPGSTVVTTAAAAKAAVDEQHRAGYDLIKVYNGVPAEAYAALAAEADARHIPFAGHVPTAVGLDGVLARGQRSIEHLEGYFTRGAEPRIGADVVAATVKSKTWNVPTLIVTDRLARLDDPASLAGTAGLEYVAPVTRAMWDPKHDFRLRTWTPETFAKMRAQNVQRGQLVAALAKAGAPLALGTDTGNPYVVPGFAVHDELGLLAAAGLAPEQALRMATASAAELAGTPGAFGVIAPGARADLILVDGDPLRDLAVLAKPAIVIARGKVHERAALLAAVAPKPVTDPFAGLPALADEGARLATAGYEVTLDGVVVGHERAVIAKAGGTTVVRGQTVFDQPRQVMQYRATRDGVDIEGGPSVTRTGGKIVAKLADGSTLDAPAGATTVIAPQSIAEFVWYGEQLASAKVGDTVKLAAVAVMTEGAPRLDPVALTFTRRPDADGRRSFELTGTYGALPVKGTFTLDPDGAPNTVEIEVTWGKLVTRRTPTP